jgi:hypothetical protein
MAQIHLLAGEMEMNDEPKKSDPPVKRTQFLHELRAHDFILEQLKPEDIKRGAPKLKKPGDEEPPSAA